MALQIVERRGSPRMEINREIAYRTCDSGEFRPGEIENLSVGGALIWIDRELPANSRILLRMEPDEEDATVFQFEAVLLHRLEKQKDSLYGYGCRFAPV